MEHRLLRSRLRVERPIQSQHHIEHGRHIRQASGEVMTGTVENLLQTTDGRDQRKRRLYQQAVIPRTPRTQLEVGWNTLGAIEAHVGQDNASACEGLHQRQEDLVMDIHRIPGPRDDLSPAIDQPTELHAHDPAPVRLALLADLSFAAALANGVDQLHAVAVDDREEGRIAQEPCAIVLMAFQQSLQPRSLWQLAEQLAIVSLQPTVERAKVAALESEKDTDCYDSATVLIVKSPT